MLFIESCHIFLLPHYSMQVLERQRVPIKLSNGNRFNSRAREHSSRNCHRSQFTIAGIATWPSAFARHSMARVTSAHFASLKDNPVHRAGRPSGRRMINPTNELAVAVGIVRERPRRGSLRAAIVSGNERSAT